jgi:hypothetical protein
MVRRFSIFAVVIIGAFSLVCSQNGKADKSGSAGAAVLTGKIDMGEFSATIVRSVAGSTFTGAMFISKDKIRDEGTVQGRKNITIIRLDKKICWVLMDNKQYMEISSMDQKDILPMEKQAEQKFTIKSLGKETVNGYPCEVKQYTCTGEDCGVTTQWYSPKLKYMVRTEHKDAKTGAVTFRQELTDIKQGTIDAALFEVPPGYVKFDPLSQVPAGMKDMMKKMMKSGAGMPKNMGSEGSK